MRILGCTVPEGEARLRKALPGEELEFAFTMEQATRALGQRRFDLVVIGMLFDESRALELMQWIRQNPSLNETRIAGIRGARVRRPISPQVFDVPMLSMGAACVIDLGAIPDDERGDDEIRARLTAGAPVGRAR